MASPSRLPPIKQTLPDTPGPGTYDVAQRPATSYRAPAFTMTGRSADLSQRVADTPGPGAYENKDTLKPSSPAFTMGIRVEEKTLGTETPGPGAYATEVKNHTPAYSLGARRGERDPENTPGPGAYDSTKLPNKPTTPSFSLSGRHVEVKKFEGPGPGAYQSDPLKVLGTSPSYTMSGRHNSKDGESCTPGPGAYETPIQMGKKSPIKK